MDPPGRRLTVALVLAAVDGLTHGLGAAVPAALVTAGVPPRDVGVALGVVSATGIVVRVGLVGAGFAWARRADVPGAYGRFAVALLGAAVVGTLVGGLALLVADRSLAGALTTVAALTPGAVFVPLPALAGGAIAQYWAVRTDPTDG